MNMNEESNPQPIDSGLEARIVALVLGEASDFERDELERLIAARPELVEFEKEIQELHGLLSDVGSGEPAPDDDWKLPTEKHDRIVAVLNGEKDDRHSVSPLLQSSNASLRQLLWNVSKIAAALLLCVSLYYVTFSGLAKEASNSVAATVSEATEPTDGHDLKTNEFIADSSLSMQYSDADWEDDAGAVDPAKPSAVLEEINNRMFRQLGEQRKTIPFYLQDDVQYSPSGPSFRPGKNYGGKLFGSAGDANSSERKTASVEERYVQDPTSLSDSPVVPTRPKLALPSFSKSQTQESVTVPDGGTVLLGGVKDNLRGATGGSLPVDQPANESGQRAASDSVKAPMAGMGLSSKPPADQDLFLDGHLAVPNLLPADSGGMDKDTDGESSDGKPGGQGGGGFGGGAAGKPSLRMTKVVEGRPGQLPREGPSLASPVINDEETLSQNVSPSLGSDNNDDGVVNIYSEHIGVRSLPIETPDVALGALFDSETAPKKDFAVDFDDSTIDLDDSTVAPDGSTISFDGIAGLPTPDLDITFNSNSFGVSPIRAPEPTAVRSRNAQIAEVADARRFWLKMSSPDQKKTPAPGPIDDLAKLQTAVSEPAELSKPMNRSGVIGDVSARPVKELEQIIINGFRRDVERVRETIQKMSEDSKRHEAPDATTPLLSISPIDPRTDPQSSTRYYDADRRFGNEQRWGTYAPPPRRTKSAAVAGLAEKSAAKESFSTFSLHVSDVSFKLAQAALAKGSWPEATKMRIEEFVNAFDYGDPMPRRNEKVACRLEQCIHPFLQQRNLMRVSMRTAAAGRSNNTPLRLTFLLDNSGSMERIDRQQTVRRAFALLAQQLKPIDQVTLICFARQPRLLADKVSGAKAGELVRRIENIPSEGGTNIEAALQLAFEKAREQSVDGAQNRIVLLTDGAVNLGNADPESLSQMVTRMREAGIAFDAAGIGADGLNDEILEALTRKGDGRYYLLDSVDSADESFVRQIAGALRPSAKNVKVQIEFNPQRVGRYKLLGFEKHLLKKEDFRNDKVDAAEMAAEEAGVAVYQFQAKPDGEGDIGTVFVRFRDLSTGEMVENSWPIPYECDAPRAEQAASSLRIAASAAMLAAKLKGGPLGETVDLKTLSGLIAGLPQQEQSAKRVQQLQTMIQQARQLSGN